MGISEAVKLARNPEYQWRINYIGIKNFFVPEKALEGKLNVEKKLNWQTDCRYYD